MYAYRALHANSSTPIGIYTKKKPNRKILCKLTKIRSDYIFLCYTDIAAVYYDYNYTSV